jgi:hypothetical protein
MRQEVPQTHRRDTFRQGCVTGNASSSPTSGRHRYASRDALSGPVDEAHNRSSKRLLILTLVLLGRWPVSPLQRKDPAEEGLNSPCGVSFKIIYLRQRRFCARTFAQQIDAARDCYND